MKNQKDYIRDLAEIRSIMERSSKFLSLSGLAGVLAGIYGLAGAYIAYSFLDFNPDEIFYSFTEISSYALLKVILLAITILSLALGTAIFLSYKRAHKSEEKLWNPTSRRLLINIMVPLIVGGVLILFMISWGLIGLIAPFSLLFYGLALFSAGSYTYKEVQFLGIIQIILGLISLHFVEYSLIFWALSFGVFHIIYGIHIKYKYER